MTGGEEATPAPVRRGEPADAAFAGALHAAGIAEGFLSSLGPGFLTILYRRVALGPGSFLLVAEVDGRPAGFIAGARSTAALYRRFLWADGLRVLAHHGVRLARAAPRVLETWRQGRGDAAGHAGGTELLAVAVAPGYAGRGVGRALVAAFLAEAGRVGDGAAHVVVGADNQRAVALYRRAGFVEAARIEVHRGVPSLVMVRSAPATAAPSAGPACR